MTLGFQRPRVVMMNEAHDGWRRCIRTRQLGVRVLPAAHAAGARHLAMEAVSPAFADEANARGEVPDAASGYLAQPEMRDFIATALSLGWDPCRIRGGLQPQTIRIRASKPWTDELA
jgi:hypothetical protein